MTIERNLVLLHSPGYQDVKDFQEIAQAVQEMAPDIEVFIASNGIPSSATRRHASKRPTLVFSPGNLLNFRPVRGKIYAGWRLSSNRQLRQLNYCDQ